MNADDRARISSVLAHPSLEYPPIAEDASDSPDEGSETAGHGYEVAFIVSPAPATPVSERAERLLAAFTLAIARAERSGRFYPSMGRALQRMRDEAAPLRDLIAKLERDAAALDFLEERDLDDEIVFRRDSVTGENTTLQIGGAERQTAQTIRSAIARAMKAVR